MSEDFIVLLAADCHSIRSHLAQTDTVTPALAAEDERFDLAVVVADAIDGEQVLADAEGGADAEAAQEELATAPLQPHLDDAAADAAARRPDVDEGADVDAMA